VGDVAARWPNILQYQVAIIKAEDGFRDERLRGLKVQRHPIPAMSWMPYAREGNFGVVYKVAGGDAAYAVKFFYHPQPDRQLRYRLIAEHLRQIARPRRLVSFAYHGAGIRVQDGEYPMLVMEWAEGDPLDIYLDKRLKSGGVVDNRRLCEEWVATLKELKSSAVAHGDLQHRNILVQADGTFRLVDYDGMFVPGMRQHGLASSEAGVAAYQHPQRRRGGVRFDERMDDFSALVILLTLAGVDIALWQQYSADGRLLLKESDLLSPRESPLLTQLAGRPGHVGSLAAVVQNAAEQEPDKVPSFSRVISEIGTEWSVKQRLAVSGTRGAGAGRPDDRPAFGAARPDDQSRAASTAQRRSAAKLRTAGKATEEGGVAGLRVFVSYSHKDERYRQRLEISLAPLQRSDLISIWHDRKILPGDEWDREIDKNLGSADLVLLLVSPDFLASEYAYSQEMAQALERHRSQSAIVVPIILRPSDWQNSPLSSLQALPREGRPVASWSDRDRAWLDIVQGLRQLISG